MPTDPIKVREARITEDYLLYQVDGFRTQDSFLDHKRRINDFDTLYDGDLQGLFPDETSLPDIPLVENKLKNATHDLARLASEAKGAHVFMKDGEGEKAASRAAVRSSITDTIWQMARGKRIERKLYLDLIACGFAAIAVYTNESSEYPIYQRLNPRFCYPDVRNGMLQDMLYVERMLERDAARTWPNLGLKPDATSDSDVHVVQYFDDYEVVQAVCIKDAKTGKAKKSHIVDVWQHGLGCVPVAWAPLDTADDSWHGLFDQLGGPLMIRNKIVKMLADYLESMVHAPMEAKGVENATVEPGPLTVYLHDETAPESFIRRVAPATPAGGVFGLLQYMDSQESSEAIQPPARVGVVRQSIASGSFVDSTQGTLSSVIFELQDRMADLRQEANYIAFKIDAKYLDHEKPLYRAIKKKTTYTPSEDMNGFYHHTVQYGASAGLNRAEAGVRVLQDMGAGLISKELARTQLDYVDDATVEQNRIDREQLASAFFQRFAGDPNTPMNVLAQAMIAMGDGMGLVEVMKQVAPDLIAAQEPAAPEGEVAEPAVAEDAAAAQQSLEAGAITPEFAPDPLQQQIVRNIF